VILPWLGVRICLIVEHDGMRERSMKQAQAQKEQFDDYVREAAGGSAAEIAKAKQLLDQGTITQEEFDALKAKALSERYGRIEHFRGQPPSARDPQGLIGASVALVSARKEAYCRGAFASASDEDRKLRPPGRRVSGSQRE
jgi:Short C-terminal domain